MVSYAGPCIVDLHGKNYGSSVSDAEGLIFLLVCVPTGGCSVHGRGVLRLSLPDVCMT